MVYELHVKGFTARGNSGVEPEKRGTFLGLIEKIPYLKELGITVVELLPVQQFDPQEGNYWGYMTLSFFAPHQAYAVRHAVKAARLGLCIPTGVSTIAATTCSTRRGITRTTASAETPPAVLTRVSVPSYWAACSIGGSAWV